MFKLYIARKFNQQLDKDLSQAGCIRSTFDLGLYFFFTGNQLAGALAVHVDDVCFAEVQVFQKEVIDKIVSLEPQEDGSDGNIIIY